jgi:hypothetical protein
LKLKLSLWLTKHWATTTNFVGEAGTTHAFLASVAHWMGVSGHFHELADLFPEEGSRKSISHEVAWRKGKHRIISLKHL